MPKKSLFSTSTLSNPTAPPSTTPSPLLPSSTIPTTFTDHLPLPSLLVFDLDYTLWPFWCDTHITPPLKPISSTSQPNTSMRDRYGEDFTFYPGVPTILWAAKRSGVRMSVASRTHAPDIARQLLGGLYVVPPAGIVAAAAAAAAAANGNGNGTDASDVSEERESKSKSTKTYKGSGKGEEGGEEKPLKASEYFVTPQMFPGSKVGHFQKIQRDLKKQHGVEVAFEDMVFFDDEARNRNVEVELGVTFVLVRDGVTREEVDRGIEAWRRRRGVERVKKERVGWESNGVNGGQED